MSTHHDDSGSGDARRRPRLGLTTLLSVVAVIALAALAMSAYGGSDSSSSDGTSDSSSSDGPDLSGEEKAGYAEFRDCMRAEGVETSPNGPPAESEKTDEMRQAFEKCGHLVKGADADGDGEGKKAGYAEFRDCMRAEGVEPSPDGPPAESEKTDEMRQAFEKCGNLIPSDVREKVGGGTSAGVLN